MARRQPPKTIEELRAERDACLSSPVPAHTPVSAPAPVPAPVPTPAAQAAPARTPKGTDEFPRHGGRRAGAGRKPRPKSAEVGQEVPTSANDDAAELRAIRLRFEAAKAKHEEWKAKTAELGYLNASKLYVSRESVRSQSAKAFAAIVQHLRSLPDNLEHKLGLDPAVAQALGVGIDDALAQLADKLAAAYSESTTAGDELFEQAANDD